MVKTSTQLYKHTCIYIYNHIQCVSYSVFQKHLLVFSLRTMIKFEHI